MKTFLFAALLFVSTSAFADEWADFVTPEPQNKPLHIFTFFQSGDEWTDADTKREAVFLGLRTFTYLQTYTAAKDGWVGLYEKNKILGKRPHQDRVTAYYAVHSLVHFAVSYYLPSDWRHVFQYVTIAEVGVAAYTNHANGIRISFPIN